MNIHVDVKLRSLALGGAVLVALLMRNLDGALMLAASSFLCIAFFSFWTSWRKYGLLTWRSGIPLFYIIYFIVLPLILNDISTNLLGVSIDDIVIGLWYASFGMTCFFGGVYFFSPIGLSMRTVHSIVTLKLLESYQVMVLLVLLGGTARFFSVFFGYSTVVIDAGSVASIFAGTLTAFSYFLMVGMLAAWASYFKNGGRKYYILGLVSLIISMGVGFFSNSKAAIVSPLALVAILNFAFYRRIPVKYIVFIALFFLFIAYPLVTSFRYIQQGYLISNTRIDVISDYVDYLVSLEWFGLHDDVDAGENFSRSLLVFFSIIVRDSGSSVPFILGDTYVHGISAFIPRFIYPDKPDLNIGNFFGKYYDIIHSADDITNLAPTMMGEFFANFGLVGLAVGMFVMGLIAVCIDSVLIGNRTSWLLPIMIVAVGWQESVVGHTFLPFIKDMTFVFLFLYLLRIFRIASVTRELPKHTS